MPTKGVAPVYTLSREPGQNVGEYEISVTAEAASNPNYTVTVDGGTFSITPLRGVTVTITEHSGSETYDAAPHTVTGYDVAISNPLYTEADFTFAGQASVTGTDAGTYISTNFDNVTFTIVDGALVIDPRPVRIIANDNSKTYGDKDPLLTFESEGLAGNDYIAAILTREIGENIGTYPISVSAIDNPNYVIETVPGTFTINARPVTVTAQDKVKVYGEADPALTAIVTGLADGDTADLISYTLSRAAGEDVGTYAITASGETEQGNYVVSYEPATLTIVPEGAVVVTITANNGTFKYDGQEKDLSGYSVSINNPLYSEADFEFTGSSELKALNAGTYRTNMKAQDFVNKNANFENVIFRVENGELEITKREIILTSADATKPYDGTALTNNKVDTTGEGFVAGEGVNLTVTGRITEVGTADNTFNYTMAAGTLEQNYNIRTEFGKLTVTPALVHKLTITYILSDTDRIVKVFSREYAVDEAYGVVSDKIDGYAADIDRVDGTMGNEDIEVTVYYRPVAFTLTVKYVSITDGSKVADSVTMTLKKGDNYTVFTPVVAGYTALQDEVSGTMPGSNRQITVFMIPDTATGADRDHVQLEIEDYGTPLGVPESILGGGEIIE